MRLDEVMSIGPPAGSPPDPSPGSDPAAGSVEISGLAYDSRRVAPGTLFFCVTGFQRDGHEYAPEAIDHGAVALVVERSLGLGVPEVLVDSARAAMGPAAARFHGDPTARLRVVGVTGTNGKTTTAFIVRALLEATGARCGLLGTVKSVIGGVEREVTRTTPEAIDLQADFRAMLDAGDAGCAMEVSSHALELRRTDGIRFSAAVFTNLTQDHLDFHPTMEDYFLAKRSLFVPADPDQPPPGVSVVSVDDPYGRRLADELAGAVTFALDAEADYRARDLRMGFAGCELTLETPAGSRPVSLPLPGRFNVANALGALAAVHALSLRGGDEIPLDTLVAALERGAPVPGRFEPVDEGQDYAVLVDYAHTPDSLDNVLRAARDLAGSGARVLCVFGAGGDRDRTKRPVMGEITARLADIVIVTSDNPRSESPDAIVAEILAGVEAADRPADVAPVEALIDRREAIARGIALARSGDVLVIAGKGHEQGQEFADGRKVPFDDVAVAREALRDSGGRARPVSGAPA
jgi:UDP-N-acetylmuramoyl-L-alanyl-D-glutamate--2,6-diaminopimelate ligase